MQTKVTVPTPATLRPVLPVQQPASPANAPAAAPQKVESGQTAPAADTADRPAFTQVAPNSALTTYKDEESGRLIVRVYDRESGDVLVEFPPEKAFRAVAPAPGGSAPKPGKILSA